MARYLPPFSIVTRRRDPTGNGYFEPLSSMHPHSSHTRLSATWGAPTSRLSLRISTVSPADPL
jgi:hypothetical protein